MNDALGETLKHVHTAEEFSALPDDEIFVPANLDFEQCRTKLLPNSGAEIADILYNHKNRRSRQRWQHLYEANDYNWKPHQLAEWQKRLPCLTSLEGVKKTFLATTQIVPSVQCENEKSPKDHHVARFPQLACKRLKETVHADIVFYANKKQKAIHFYCGTSKLKAVYKLHHGASSAACLEIVYEFIRDFGCPQHLKSDFANNLAKGENWKRLTKRLITKIGASEAHKYNQNQAERSWRDLQKV